jgi:hypothetical protein
MRRDDRTRDLAYDRQPSPHLQSSHQQHHRAQRHITLRFAVPMMTAD